ncbi:hypothetical protein A3H10_02505 [Candidatus Uhrbacteria bacterium RIFCSPLOWO2_12_FULL_46_10]|uniref:Uncharacterized protein n=1 Tax=Candidatus Uhrbacteria bacterium RIFCSPLOWO2_01_FULL_47_25 TaxID=1802402 RepID=A0A1F7UVY1_9BACT|nr:MAG: hypothetical protein UX68_C0018G0020 [Parcubacteria group bacterium GW2011_GWA2_46_9]OGL58885.1 MAG: hypothetical protein A2752_04880 [Candidatus Uhrbacteria bacterium RIFCSPHIGHO2_01_FULL_46_23]OGL69409.1 MAG: hypothetical protein A3D60_01035 [Candidatus Uhrbacteria bacterium RIFCSPHIGHO2_02_FULL_47_29]OGL76789.1 MAG: hypothetical protein A3E96_01605 [Candidatus Uhrbacteria bacterium RIFCSPHIGHO2_12_FULL_46_13]OGL82429.1 MAG: hypothetical protein A2936_03155 [Candidatus Uhrbacteria bac
MKQLAVNTALLQIGREVFPVYGDDDTGFSILAEDLSPLNPKVLYESLDELFFALVNLNITPEGLA